MLLKFTPNLFLFITLLLLMSSCQLGRFVYYNFANITDYKIFPSKAIQNEGESFQFYEGNQNRVPDSLTLTLKEKKSRIPFEEYLTDNKTVAFLVIRNDTLEYEKYFYKYDEASIVASFSMAKSVNSILIGCAIQDGFIKSVDEPITNYLPDLKENGFEKVTIKHLLQMTSGIRFNESYSNPFGDAASFYYGRNLKRNVGKLELVREPGTKFYYSSGDAQILGLVLASALKDKTISTYLEEKIWKPMGMEYDASWSLDKNKNGVEKTFCCLNARARDFAKLGRLYLNNGNWNGKQLVPEEWVKESTKTDTTAGSVDYYQYQWWLPEEGTFTAQGILGQFIYVNPAKKLIIVRLGKKTGKTSSWESLFKVIASKYD
jgi:CubicO group peptidase (beta-lactamase class C family)